MRTIELAARDSTTAKTVSLFVTNFHQPRMHRPFLVMVTIAVLGFFSGGLNFIAYAYNIATSFGLEDLHTPSIIMVALRLLVE